jgi:hypothetical protein
MSAGRLERLPSRMQSLLRWRPVRIVAVLVGLVVILAVGQLAWPLCSASLHVRALQDLAGNGLQPSTAPAALLTASTELSGLEGDLGSVEEAALVGLAARLGFLPRIGYTLASAPSLLRMARLTAHAGQVASRGLAPAVSAVAARGAQSQRRMALSEALTPQFLAGLEEGQPQFTSLQEDLTAIAAERRSLEPSRLAEPVAEALAQLDRYLPAFGLLPRSESASVLLPSLLGLSVSRTYLLLAQNADELRATGGFISSIGLVRVEGGIVKELDFRDSYAVDDLSLPYPPAPEPLSTYMRAGLWLTRDANWSPDFPKSAQTAERLYQIGQSMALDGVIGVDTTMVQLLVSALGPLLVEPYGEWVDAGNLTAKLRQFYTSPQTSASTSDWWSHRKDFSGALLKAILKRMEGDLTTGETLRLLAAVQVGLEQRHLQLYLHDPRAGRLLAQYGWDGAVRENPGDYLMVVDTNMGYNKVNGHIRESIDYRVFLSVAEDSEDWALTQGREPGSLPIKLQARGELTITYYNDSDQLTSRCVQRSRDLSDYDALTHGCYWDYLRVYVPDGSKLLEVTPLSVPEGSLHAQATGATGILDAEVTREAGKTAFGLFFVVPPGSQKVITLTYELPESVVPDQMLSPQGAAWMDLRYSLIVQKQAGTEALPVRVTVSGLAGWRVAGAQPSAHLGDPGQVLMESDLARDRGFDVLWEVPWEAPWEAARTP